MTTTTHGADNEDDDDDSDDNDDDYGVYRENQKCNGVDLIRYVISVFPLKLCP